MLAYFANPRLATEALAQIRNLSLNSINLHCSKLLGSTTASRSSNATTSNSALDRLATSQPPHPRRSNPHSASRTSILSIPAVSSLGGFRTPAPGVRGTVRHGPAPENLHKNGSRGRLVSLPLWPRERTSLKTTGMSEKCQRTKPLAVERRGSRHDQHDSATGRPVLR